MFIERSAGRIRRARAAFLVLGLLPFAVLAGWAIQRRSAAHREDVRGRWQHALGLGMSIDAVEHPRPGVTRARGVSIVSPTGSRLVEFPLVEVEAAVGEDRLRVDVVRLDGRAAAAIGDLAREWLRRDARHPRNCVIDVEEVSWSSGRGGAADASDASSRGLRVECVAQDGTRAIRATRREGNADLLRVVRSVVAAADGAGGERLEIEADLEDSVPLDVVMALAGFDAGPAIVVGEQATIAGRCTAVVDDEGWRGDASGRLLGIDVSRCVAPLGTRAAGEASLDVDRLAWRGGRLVAATARCRVGPGWIDPAFCDRLAMALGCRPARAAADGSGRRFDAAGFGVRVDGGGVVIGALPETPRALAVVDGAVLLDEPPNVVPFERLAWVLSPPSAAFVPAGGAGAWLMSVQPREGGGREASLPGGGGDERSGKGF
jgi:hypothetical protein